MLGICIHCKASFRRASDPRRPRCLSTSEIRVLYGNTICSVMRSRPKELYGRIASFPVIHCAHWTQAAWPSKPF